MGDGYTRRSGSWVLTLLLVLCSHPALAATIVVDQTTCTLGDAIRAANDDAASGGCPAGSGPDTIQLATDVLLNAADSGSNGLPQVTSEVAVEGGGFTVERAAAAPDFRLFRIASSGTATMNDITLLNGSASEGAGLVNLGVLTLTNATLSGHSASFGGAILNGGSLFVSRSTLSGNAASFGGGVLNGGSLELKNATLSGNSAAFFGGGLHNVEGGTVTVANATLSGNSAGIGGGGVYNESVLPLIIANSIVADSPSGGNCDDALTPITDAGGNFSDDASCGGGFAGISPGADYDVALADNGGATRTHALTPASVAINAAGACGLATDQRGVPRDDGACDSGAFEFNPDVKVPATSAVALIALAAGLTAVVTAAVLVRRRTGSVRAG